MSYRPDWTDGSPQSLRPDGTTSLPGPPSGGPQAPGLQSRRPPAAGPDGPPAVSRVAWGGWHEWQRSVRSVRESGRLWDGNRDRGDRDGGGGDPEGGEAVVALGRGARPDGRGRPVADRPG